jgi:outer membrane protein assembly factor BamB
MDDLERLLSSSLKEVRDANMKWHPNFEARTRTAVRGIHRRRLVRAVALAGAAFLLLTGVAAALMTGIDRERRVPPSAPGDSGLQTTTIRGVGIPEDLDSSGAAVWVVSSGELFRIDPATNEVDTSVFDLPVSTFDLAGGGGVVWTVGWTGDMGPGGGSPVQGAIQRIEVSDLAKGVPFERVGSVERFPGREALDSVAVGAGGVWVTNRLGDELWRLDPSTGRIAARIPVDGSPVDVAVTDEGVWVVHTSDDPDHHGAGGSSLVRVDPRTNTVVAGPVRAGDCPGTVQAVDGAVWVLDHCGQAVRRFHGGTLQLLTTSIVGKEPVDLALGGGFVWVLNSGSVQRIDADGGELVGEPLSVGEPSHGALTYGAGSAWATASFTKGSTLDVDDVGVLRIDQEQP